MKRPMAEREIGLVTAFNFRDLGGFAVEEGGQTRFGLVYRSDALHRVNVADHEVLAGLGLGAVFDLRSSAELETDGVGSFVGTAVPHHHAPMMAVTLNPYDQQVDWRGIDLEERYVAMLAEGKAAIRQVLDAVARSAGEGIVFHCTAGKDRTGVLAAVLLRAVGVAPDAIIADYALSGPNIAHIIDGYRTEMAEAGLDDEAIEYLISSPPRRMLDTLAALDERWGGIDAYLDSIGFDAELRDQLRSRFVDRA
jgi:protein-tyrosine phosphatase